MFIYGLKRWLKMKNDKMNKILDENIMFEIIDQQLNTDQMFPKYGISKEYFDLFVKEYQEM